MAGDLLDDRIEALRTKKNICGIGRPVIDVDGNSALGKHGSWYFDLPPLNYDKKLTLISICLAINIGALLYLHH